jgi:predicted Rossmann-fold nucleotide-binding protein
MKIAVFCGSSVGNNSEFIEAAKALGKHFGENGIDLVYGGGKVGLMGIIKSDCQ